MKTLLLIVLGVGLVLVAGCGMFAESKTQAGSTTCIGLKVGLDEQNRPVVYLGYLKVDVLAVAPGADATISRDYKNVSLFSTTGDFKTSVEVKQVK